MARCLSRPVVLLVVCCFVLVTVASCAIPKTLKEHPTAAGAAAGGVIGGAAGGMAGSALGGTKGAIIGAVAGTLAGALAGGALGHYLANRSKDAEQTAKDEGVTLAAAGSAAAGTQAAAVQKAAAPEPPKGAYVKLKTIEVEPAEAGPGDTIKINFVYALLTPANPKATVVVEEKRAITHNGEEVGTVTFSKEHTNGTWTTTVPLALSSQAEPGTYLVTGAVKAEGEKATDSTTFQVEKRY